MKVPIKKILKKELAYEDYIYLEKQCFIPIIERIAEEYANQDKWISDRTPEFIQGKNYSENVLAEVEGMTEVQVMCYIYIEGKEGGFAWANCYQNLDGDAEFDDNYNVIKWQPIPKI